VIPPYNREDQGTPQENPISKSSGDSGDTAGPSEVATTGGSGRIPTKEEEGGLGDTDLDPQPVMGAGEHISHAGERTSGADSGEAGQKGPSGRPEGTTDEGPGIGAKQDASPVAGEPGDQGG